MRLLLWLSGEHPTMPRAEAVAAFQAEEEGSKVVAERPRLLIVDSKGSAEDALRIVARLGLCHDASEFLFESEWEPTKVEGLARVARLSSAIRFAVRADRLGSAGPRRMSVERDLGAFLGHGRRVDLAAPGTIVRAFIDGDYVWVGRQLWERDPKDTASRHVKHRPVGSPVSLPPKTARAMLNLALTPRGGSVYDPFCGTGGVLLEAAAMGFRPLGSDLDPDMVEASRTNLAHFAAGTGELFQADIGDAPRQLKKRKLVPDAIVCDLPYGRSASTGKEAITKLYDRSFEAIRDALPKGRRAVLGLPSEAAAKRAQEFLEPVDVFKVWVHRTLTRHFVVVRQP